LEKELNNFGIPLPKQPKAWIISIENTELKSSFAAPLLFGMVLINF